MNAFDLLPWWVYALAGLVAFAVAWRFLGLRAALAIGAAALGAVIYRKGRDTGRLAERDSKASQERTSAVARTENRNEIRAAPDAELDARLDRWVRK